MYINLMETIITSVNHRIEAQASITTNELDPGFYSRPGVCSRPGFYDYINTKRMTSDNIMYQPFNRHFVQYTRTPTLR